MNRNRTVGLAAFVIGGLVVAAALAFFVSPQASSKPDGLNKVAIDKGFDHAEKPHAVNGSPTAHYAVTGVDNDRLSTGLAGLIGVAATFAVALGLMAVIRRGNAGRNDSEDPSTMAGAASGEA